MGEQLTQQQTRKNVNAVRNEIWKLYGRAMKQQSDELIGSLLWEAINSTRVLYKADQCPGYALRDLADVNRISDEIKDNFSVEEVNQLDTLHQAIEKIRQIHEADNLPPGLRNLIGSMGGVIMASAMSDRNDSEEEE